MRSSTYSSVSARCISGDWSEISNSGWADALCGVVQAATPSHKAIRRAMTSTDTPQPASVDWASSLREGAVVFVDVAVLLRGADGRDGSFSGLGLTWMDGSNVLKILGFMPNPQRRMTTPQPLLCIRLFGRYLWR